MNAGTNLKRLVEGIAAPDYPEEAFRFPEDPRVPDLLQQIDALKAKITELECSLAEAQVLGFLDLDMYAPIGEIAELVAKKTRISVENMRSDRRDARTSLARHILMYLGCQYTKLSTMRIGKYLRKDHTSVMYGRNRIKLLLTQAIPNAAIKTAIDQIVAELELNPQESLPQEGPNEGIPFLTIQS